MSATVRDPRVEPLSAILALNTDLVINCCQGLSEPDATRRIDGRGNSIAFLAAHVTDARHYLLDHMGVRVTNPLSAVLEGARTIDDITSLPPLSEILTAWRSVSGHVSSALASLDTSRLEAPAPDRFPIAGGTVLAMATFLTQHESYHIGQMAYLRRWLGYDTMSYQRDGEAGAT